MAKKELKTINIKTIRADKSGRPYIAIAEHMSREGFIAVFENSRMIVEAHHKPFFVKEIGRVKLNFYYWEPEKTLFNI